MKLTGVAPLILRPHLLDGQLTVTKSPAQTDPAHKRLLDTGLALPVGKGHCGAVALLSCLGPQHLVHLLREGEPAGEGGGLPIYGCLVALVADSTCGRNMKNVTMVIQRVWLFVCRCYSNKRGLGFIKTAN